MTKVTTGASMSLDGYIAGPAESGFEHLFAWYGIGDVEIRTADPNLTMRLTEQSARHFQNIIDSTGSIVVGRRLFDSMNAWGGQHPMGCPVVVLTHSVPEGWPQEGEHFVFATEGIEAAIAKAKELAGDRNVALNGGTISSQAVDAGLLEELWIDLVPVLLGSGTPFFSSLSSAPVLLDGPISVVEGERVTHLRYAVRR